MLKYFLAGSFLSFLIGAFVAGPEVLGYRPSVETVGQDVVKVVMKNEYAQGHGTGTILKDGTVLTAAHVAIPNVLLFVKTNEAEYPAKILWRSPESDVAIVVADRLLTGNGRVACSDQDPGARVYSKGNPLNEENLLFFGRVSNYPTNKDKRWTILQTLDMTGGAGMSGGPVFNKRGEVTGIVVAGYGQTGGIMFMVPGSEICRLMEERRG